MVACCVSQQILSVYSSRACVLTSLRREVSVSKCVVRRAKLKDVQGLGDGCIEGRQRPLHLCSTERRLGCLLLLYNVEFNARKLKEPKILPSIGH